MTKICQKILAALVGLGAATLQAACVAPVGAEGVSVSPDSAKICAEQCQTIGMRLSAVAIMANNVGCVCQPAAQIARNAAAQRAVPAAGMSTILMQQAQASRQHRYQMQHRR